jgi:hypothetical protein
VSLFRTLLKREKLPLPVEEYRFAPPRRWRFDYSWVDAKVALEVEGGAWIRGRHTRGKGFVADMDKYNAAVVQGWRVLRTTPQNLCTLETTQMLRAVLTAAGC